MFNIINLECKTNNTKLKAKYKVNLNTALRLQPTELYLSFRYYYAMSHHCIHDVSFRRSLSLALLGLAIHLYIALPVSFLFSAKLIFNFVKLLTKTRTQFHCTQHYWKIDALRLT